MLLQRALYNIFKEEESTGRDVQVIKALGSKQFKTKDVFGRIWVVLSDQTWAVDSYVTIQRGRIIGSAEAFPTPRIYNV